MKCPKCQFENREEVKFCRKCSTKVYNYLRRELLAKEGSGSE